MKTNLLNNFLNKIVLVSLVIGFSVPLVHAMKKIKIVELSPNDESLSLNNRQSSSSTMPINSNEPTPAPSPGVGHLACDPIDSIDLVNLAKVAFASMINPDDTIKDSDEDAIFNDENECDTSFDEYFDTAWGRDSEFFTEYLPDGRLKNVTEDIEITEDAIECLRNQEPPTANDQRKIERLKDELFYLEQNKAYLQITDCTVYLHAVLILKHFLTTEGQTVVFNKHTCNRLITTALCLACKFHMDDCVYNSDVWGEDQNLFDDVNTAEKRFLNTIDWSFADNINLPEALDQIAQMSPECQQIIDSAIDLQALKLHSTQATTAKDLLPPAKCYPISKDLCHPQVFKTIKKQLFNLRKAKLEALLEKQFNARKKSHASSTRSSTTSSSNNSAGRTGHTGGFSSASTSSSSRNKDRCQCQ